MTLHELSGRIDEQIAEALSLAEHYDPRDLLSMVGIGNGFYSVGTSGNVSEIGSVAHIEYAQSLILATEFDTEREIASAETASNFDRVVGTIFASVGNYYGEERRRSAEPDDLAAELRYATVLNHMNIRINSHEMHLFDLLRGLFGAHDPFFRTNFGLDVNTIISSLTGIMQRMNSRLERYAAYITEGFGKFEHMREQHVKEQSSQASDVERLGREWEALPHIRPQIEEFQGRERELRHQIFRIEPSDGVPESFLGAFAATLGTNARFLSSGLSGWPGTPTIVESKPLVEHAGEYHCYAPALFYHYAVGILEDLLKERDQNYFGRRYAPQRAAYLEGRALGHLSDLLPGAEAYGPLYYRIREEDGSYKRVETDGVILYDNNVVIVEAKAGLFSDSARRGSLLRMRRDAKDLVDKAYGQAARTRKYISEEAVPRFEHEDGSEALVMRDKGQYENFYLVNVTLAHLGPVSARLSTLRALELVDGDGWPWSVFVDDLRVVSEILDSPSEFLLYLKGRIRSNDHGKVISFSELDLLGYFLQEGLEFEHEYYDSYDRVILGVYDTPLVDHYEYLAGRMPTGPKPRLNAPEDLRQMVADLERAGRLGFTEVTTTLLRLGLGTQEDMLERLEQVKRMSARDGTDHDLTMTFPQLDVGITFLTRAEAFSESLDELRRTFQKAMNREGVGRWMLVAVDARPGRGEVRDFRIFRPQPAIKKVGRNEPCPCGSGKKYKKCCGKVKE